MNINSRQPSNDDDDIFGSSNDDAAGPLREIERRMNIQRLQNEFQEITGVASSEQQAGQQDPTTPIEITEGFWQSVVEWEKAPDTTHAAQWKRNHASLPPDVQLSDEKLHALLWQVIKWMTARRTYLENTDHLSDRELYRYLRDEAMCEWTKEFTPRSLMNCHISPIGSGSEEDNILYMRFYADDDYRASWARQFPQDFIPEHQAPPYDRDRLLPQPNYALYENHEDEAQENDL